VNEVPRGLPPKLLLKLRIAGAGACGTLPDVNTPDRNITRRAAGSDS
jgi:hypothetical protein